MGHALHQIWTSLSEAGTLVDLRPVSSQCPVEIVTRETMVLVAEIGASGMAVDDAAADQAAREAVERKWFVPLAATELTFDVYWGDFREMEASIADSERMTDVTPSVAELERAHGGLLADGEDEARVRCRRTMMIAVYRKSTLPKADMAS